MLLRRFIDICINRKRFSTADMEWHYVDGFSLINILTDGRYFSLIKGYLIFMLTVQSSLILLKIHYRFIRVNNLS